MSFNFNIIIPVYNEGENLIKVINHLKKNVKANYQILICYDDDSDNLFQYMNEILNINKNIKLIKNNYHGPCGAVKTGLEKSETNAMIVYPADDLINGNILDDMYTLYLKGYDIVAPSRFMKGGSLKNCPLIKEIIVRFASFTLFKLSSIPVEDASNGFRLFSKKIINRFNIESELGFAYSLELLVKAERNGYKIKQIPSQWLEIRMNNPSNSPHLLLERWWFESANGRQLPSLPTNR